MTEAKSPEKLARTVISNGYCVGCGACASRDRSPFQMIMDEYGQFQSRLREQPKGDQTEDDYEKICPFGAEAPTEDKLAEAIYANDCAQDEHVGFYNGVFAGHVVEGDYRTHGSSGGMGSWILNELLEKDLVDYVVHVKSDGIDEASNNIPFKYQVSATAEEVRQGGKSRYYPIEMSGVLKTIEKIPGRYAIIGLPCFIKSIRLLQAQDQMLAERIKYCIGLVCGHLKSAHYAESLAWQMGISPQSLNGIDFRVKNDAGPANRYGTYASDCHVEKVVPTNQLFGADWGAGAFKYKACDFCDDVFAETADMVLGDAWLPQYVADSSGTNVVVTRKPELLKLIQDARAEQRLAMDDLPVADAARSQDAGLRHRKGAISYRLFLEQMQNRWVPSKRSSPAKHLTPKGEMKRQRLRTELRVLSHQSFLRAKDGNDLSVYLSSMRPVYLKYRRQGRSLINRLLHRIKRGVVSIARGD